MPQTPRRSQATFPAGRARPGQDMSVVRKQAGQFPAVGMTLRSYKYDPKDYHKTSGAKGVVVKQGRWRRLWHKITWKRSLITLLIAVLLVGGWVGGKFVYNAHRLFGGSIFGLLSSTKLQGEDVGRVNILLAGNSADDPGHQGADLTDSIMIISLDTRNNTAFLLSVPRDLWVNIPGNGYSKINQAYPEGQSDNFNDSGYFSGGMGQLQQVVEQDFGITLNYYVLVNYAALKDAVNAVGGIKFTVNSSDPRGIYDPDIDYATGGPLVKLSNGVHEIDGEQALDIARARGDSPYAYGFPDSDFDRTQNQRQIIVDIKNKAMTAGVLANPAKLTSLFDAVGANVKTDFTLSDAKRLYQLVKPIKSSNIESLSLNSADGKDLLANYEAPDGESALIPAAGLNDYNDIQAYVRQQTSSNPIVQEGADVVVLNATNTDGLAAKQRTLLSGKGVNVSAIGDAYSNQTATTIIDNSDGKLPLTRALLIKQYGNNVTTSNPYAYAYPDADFIVLVGSDQVSAVTSDTAQ